MAYYEKIKFGLEIYMITEKFQKNFVHNFVRLDWVKLFWAHNIDLWHSLQMLSRCVSCQWMYSLGHWLFWGSGPSLIVFKCESSAPGTLSLCHTGFASCNGGSVGWGFPQWWNFCQHSFLIVKWWAYHQNAMEPLMWRTQLSHVLGKEERAIAWFHTGSQLNGL